MLVWRVRSFYLVGFNEASKLSLGLAEGSLGFRESSICCSVTCGWDVCLVEVPSIPPGLLMVLLFPLEAPGFNESSKVAFSAGVMSAKTFIGTVPAESDDEDAFGWNIELVEPPRKIR